MSGREVDVVSSPDPTLSPGGTRGWDTRLRWTWVGGGGGGADIQIYTC